MLMRKPLGRRSHGKSRRVWKKSVKILLGSYCNWMRIGACQMGDG